jgi:hypothetical protein
MSGNRSWLIRYQRIIRMNFFAQHSGGDQSAAAASGSYTAFPVRFLGAPPPAAHILMQRHVC